MAHLTTSSLMKAERTTSQGTGALVAALQEGRLTPLSMKIVGREGDILTYARSCSPYPGFLFPGDQKGTCRLLVEGEPETASYATYLLEDAAVDAVLQAF